MYYKYREFGPESLRQILQIRRKFLKSEICTTLLVTVKLSDICADSAYIWQTDLKISFKNQILALSIRNSHAGS